MSIPTKTTYKNPQNVPTIPPKRHPLTPTLQQLKNRIIPSIFKHPHSAPFRIPINPRILPDYPSIIANPMDLATLSKRLSNGWYSTSADCVADFTLMVSNCLKYNHSSDNVSKLARSINALFGEMVDEMTEKEPVPGKSTRPERRLVRELKTNAINRPLELVTKLMDSKYHGISGHFMNPVDLGKYPDYSSLVATPIDLNGIKQSAQNRKYACVTDLVHDVRLLLSNCYVYNIPGSDLYDYGASLQKYFEKMLHIPGFQGYGNCPYYKDKLLKIKNKLDEISSDISTLKRSNVSKSRPALPTTKSRPQPTTKKVAKEVNKGIKKKYSVAAKKDLIAKLRKHIPSREIALMKSNGLFGLPGRGLNIAKLDDSQLEVIDTHMEIYMAKNIIGQPPKPSSSPRCGQKRQIPSVLTNRSKVSKVKRANEFIPKEEDDDTLFIPENLDIPKSINWPKMVVSPPSAEFKFTPNVQKSKLELPRPGLKTSNREPDSLIDTILNAPEAPKYGVITMEDRREWARLKAIDRTRRNAHNEHLGVNLMEQYDLFSLMEDELIDYTLK